MFTLGQLKQIEYEYGTGYGAGLPVASAKSALMSSVPQLPEEHTEITALPLPPGKQRAKAEVHSQTQGESKISYIDILLGGLIQFPNSL